MMGHVLRAGVALLCLLAPALAAPKTDLVLAIGGEPETGFDPLFGWNSGWP